MRKLITALLLTIVAASLRGETFTGTFDYRRSGLTEFSSANFTFDTVTGAGQITELNPAQGGYVTKGLWNFTVQIADHDLFGGSVVITSFNDLVDFSTRTLTVEPEIGSTYTMEGEIQWHIFLGQPYGTISSSGYSLTDAASFNAYFESGDVANFTLIPEPSAFAALMGSITLVCASVRRKRIRKSRSN